MAFPAYRPFTRHDRRNGLSVMAIGSAMFTIAVCGMLKNDSSSNIRTSWLIIGSSTLLFFSGILWLAVNYRYTQRSWWDLIVWGGSSSGVATGLAIMSVGTHNLLPMVYSIRAWTGDVAVVLSVDSTRENQAGYYEEADVAEYAIGTPHDPKVRSW
jgi:hypothetical protein